MGVVGDSGFLRVGSRRQAGRSAGDGRREEGSGAS